ncbi:hypothetical protein, partial [Bradyrhizobium sp.]|uniref:hypothetical protein n=1 Tax=Bradyrhizobium sp. TaxID=376 RepID=UPI003C73B6D4
MKVILPRAVGKADSFGRKIRLSPLILSTLCWSFNKLCRHARPGSEAGVDCGGHPSNHQRIH